MAIKSKGKAAKIPVKHLTSEHLPAFIMQAIIFAVVVLVVSFGVFVLTFEKPATKVTQNEKATQSTQPLSEQIKNGQLVDESIFKTAADSSIDPKKLEGLFPDFKTQ